MVTPQMVLRGAIARTGVRPFPLSLTYEVTWLCNLSCGYCDRHTPMRNELTQEEIFSALDEFRMLGMLHTHLDGGDPLTHRHIDEIVDWLTQRGVTVSLNSNGILVPKKLHTIRKLSVLKISLDGPHDSHDAMRGTGSFEKALAGATAARDAGVKVEFTCTVGQHNAHTIEPLIDIASAVSIPVVFQPALNSLFLDADRDGSSWQLDVQSIRAAFAQIERIKRRSNVVGNGWSSLRHFRRFPEDTRPPCSAGWVHGDHGPRRRPLFLPPAQPERPIQQRHAARGGDGIRQSVPNGLWPMLVRAPGRGKLCLGDARRSHAPTVRTLAEPIQGRRVSPEGLDLAAPQSASIAPGTSPRLISWLDWLRYGPFLAQVIVTRRCNLRCGYCTEYDKTSEPVPFDALRQRLEVLRDLRTWAVSLMGGEPTLHPDLLKNLLHHARLGVPSPHDDDEWAPPHQGDC